MDRLSLTPSGRISQAAPTAGQEPIRTPRIYQHTRDLNGITGARDYPIPGQDIVLPEYSLGRTADSFLVAWGFDLVSRVAIFRAFQTSDAAAFVGQLSGGSLTDKELLWLWNVSVHVANQGSRSDDDDWYNAGAGASGSW